MSFGTITVGTKTYQERQPGTYVDSTLTFASPNSDIRTKGASPKNKVNPLTASVLRRLEKDVTVGAAIVRKSSTIQVVLSAPQDATFTNAEIAAMVTDLATFLTAANISRLLQGES